jgi:hypothetical protein
VRDYVAGNFGTWSVNEADKTLIRHYDGALNPNNDGTDTKVTVSLSGDELRLSTVSPGVAAPELIPSIAEPSRAWFTTTSVRRYPLRR